MATFPGDVELTNVETALKIANDGSYPTAVADETAIQVMLLSKWRHEQADTPVHYEAKRSIEKSLQIISIKETESLLPTVVPDNLLFTHAWSKCDAVSGTYSHGKTKLLKLFEPSPEPIAEICNIFSHKRSVQEEVARADM